MSRIPPAFDPGIAVSPPQSHKEDAPSDSAPVKKRRWQGWQVTILGGAVAIAFSLVCNIAMLIVGLARYDSGKGRGHLAVGSCTAAPKIDTALHVLINVLSALLLGASNAAMQCLSAPTRANLDTLHARGAAADIGISGFRNLRFMSPMRRTLWAILLLSSLPLHLLYNSVVTSTITVFRWHGFLVTPDFTQRADWNHNLTEMMGASSEKLATLQDLAARGELETLSQQDCIQTFSGQFAQAYASVLMITGNVPYSVPSNTGSVLALFTPEVTDASSDDISVHNLTYVERLAADGKDSQANGLADLIHDAHISTPFAYWPLFWNPPPRNIPNWYFSQGDFAAPIPELSFVDHCLAERVENLCTVDVLPAVQGLVVFANLVKLVCFLIIFFRLKSQPLVTVGDAIASYLARPDETTTKGGMIDMTRPKTPRNAAASISAWDTALTRHRWFRGVSLSRWMISGMLCIGYWLVGVTLLSLLAENQANSGSITSGFNRGDIQINAYKIGLGAELDNPTAQTVRAVIFANCFQLLLSIAYFQYNGVVTSMLLSREFTNFARDRKGLRVSIPQGAQRRTFWLSLPYSYSIPLLILASLLHWLLSEAVFYQEVSQLEGDVIFSKVPTGFIGSFRSGTYVSMEPLFVLLIVAASCMLVVAGLGFRRYAGGIPIVRSNSLAICAACHPRAGERFVDVLLPIQWGVRGHNTDGTADRGFSSEEVDTDASLIKLDAAERTLHHVKNGFNARIKSLVHRSRKQNHTSQYASESTEGIMMHDPRSHSRKTNNRTVFDYAPLDTHPETTYDMYTNR